MTSYDIKLLSYLVLAEEVHFCYIAGDSCGIATSNIIIITEYVTLVLEAYCAFILSLLWDAL